MEAEERTVCLKAEGTERRNKTSIDSGMERADMTVFEVAVWRPRLEASESSSL